MSACAFDDACGDRPTAGQRGGVVQVAGLVGQVDGAGISSGIVSGVGDILSDAASAVSEIVESVVSPKSKATRGAKKEGDATPRKTAAKRGPRPKKTTTEE